MRIQDIIVQLLLKQPFYGYIASSVTPVECTDIATTKMITDPSLKLLYNREWYEKLNEKQAIGVILHEILHLVFMHPFRKGNRDRNLWIISCDMAVNEYIDSILLSKESITVDKISKEFKENILPLRSAEFYYDIISKNDNMFSFIERNNEISVVLKSGVELKANDCVEGDSAEINKNAFKSMFSDIISQAKSDCDVPENISGIVDEIYKGGIVNWRNVLRRFISGKGKMQSMKTFKKESKRYEGLPGNKRMKGISALIAIDESGSINSRQSGEFFSTCVSPLFYENEVREALMRFKFNDTTAYAPVFGGFIGDCIAENLRAVTI
jgi:predicted metal-dependent peptidase